MEWAKAEAECDEPSNLSGKRVADARPAISFGFEFESYRRVDCRKVKVKRGNTRV